MAKVRLNVNLLKIEGSRVIRVKNAAGVPTNYVAVPIDQCYAPEDGKAICLMGTMIATPNGLFSDYVIKKFVSASDFKMMSEEQRAAVPIIGKGVIMKEHTPREIDRMAEEVEVEGD